MVGAGETGWGGSRAAPGRKHVGMIRFAGDAAPGPPCHTLKTQVDRRGVSLTHTADYRDGAKASPVHRFILSWVREDAFFETSEAGWLSDASVRLLDGTIILHPPAVTPAQAGVQLSARAGCEMVPGRRRGDTECRAPSRPTHRHPRAKTRGPKRSPGQSPRSPIGPRGPAGDDRVYCRRASTALHPVGRVGITSPRRARASGVGE